MPKQSLHVELDEGVHTAIKLLCVEHRISLKNLVNQCFLEKLGRKPFEPFYESEESWEDYDKNY